MPRPSMKEERQAAILEAYGRCIARYGVAGTTLELIAEKAGLARALIRHNVGNKDDILEAFLDHYIAIATAEVDELFDSLPEKRRVATMIEWLFDPDYTDAQSSGVSNALFTAATENPKLARVLSEWSEDFTARIANEVQGNKEVATGIVALYFNFDAMAPLGDADRLRRVSEAAANRLVSTLD